MRLAAVLAVAIATSACRATPEPDVLDGTWRMDPARSHYAGTAEARRAESFACRSRAAVLACDIVAIRLDGDTTRSSFEAVPGKGAGVVSGVDGVDRVLLLPREDGYDAVFLDRTHPVFGYRITVDGDSLVVRTTDASTGESLETRVVYVRRAP